MTTVQLWPLRLSTNLYLYAHHKWQNEKCYSAVFC